MREKLNIQFYYCWFILLIRNAHSVSTSGKHSNFNRLFINLCILLVVPLMSFCNQSLNMSSTILLITYTNSTSSSPCCNITLTSDSNDQIKIQLKNIALNHPALKISNKQMQTTNDMMDLPIVVSLCQLNLLPTFEMTLIKSKSISPVKIERKIRGGIVTSIMVLGSLLIIASVSIALAFVYFRRKAQRRRQLTASLESTSDDWEPSGTGYRLFDNWTHHHRRHIDNHIDNLHIDANEHMPITTNMTIR